MVIILNVCLLNILCNVLFIFLGGGGVGKSRLINVVARYADKILSKVGDNHKNPKILLLAPTGKAASLIGKSKKMNKSNDL